MSRFKVRVFLRGKHAENVVVLMDWFAIIASLLFIPPVGIWVTELALFGGWIDVAAILLNQYSTQSGIWAMTDHVRVINICLRDTSNLGEVDSRCGPSERSR